VKVVRTVASLKPRFARGSNRVGLFLKKEIWSQARLNQYIEGHVQVRSPHAALPYSPAQA
jgi:hypothetical protein